MKAFEFRLQRVADFRQQQLDVLKSRLQALTAEMNKLDEELESLASQRTEAEHNIASRAGLTGEDVLALANFQEYLSRRANQIKQKKVELSSKIDHLRTEVIEAERKVKLLGRLKDRKLQEWTAESNLELD